LAKRQPFHLAPAESGLSLVSENGESDTKESPQLSAGRTSVLREAAAERGPPEMITISPVRFRHETVACWFAAK